MNRTPLTNRFLTGIFLLSFITTESVAQEQFSSMSYNPQLYFKVQRADAAKRKSQGDTLSLPFIDDFSGRSVYPNPKRWEEKYAFINDNFPANKLSYGVATLDGLDELGLPYSRQTNHGSGADTLTSLPLDLSGLTINSNVALSFFYEPQGLGDWPDEQDSLILEFKRASNVWVSVWEVPGFSAEIDTPHFKSIRIPIVDPNYFYKGFQFRFRNYATITGNNDHWNLDYVYLDDSRTLADSLRDVTGYNPPEHFLKNYSSMPWYQYDGFQQQETKNTFLVISARNNNRTSVSLNFHSTISDIVNNGLIDTFKINLSLGADTTSPTAGDAVRNTTSIKSYNPANQDSVTIALETYFDALSSTLDNPIENDTVVRKVKFRNYLAYDDGTAEIAYGIQGQGLKKFALEFNLNKPDTLRAIQIMFSQINQDISLLYEFTLMVWGRIDVDNNEEDTLYIRQHVPFYYEPGPNGFAQYVLEEPLVLPSGSFYIGWQHFFPDNVNIQVGFDRQNNEAEHIFYYIDDRWKRSSLLLPSAHYTGTPMIRAVIGKDVPLVGSPVEEVGGNGWGNITIYPNPVKDYLYFTSLKKSSTYQLRVFDLSGQTVLSQQATGNKLDVSALKNGVYILLLADGERNRQSYKFIKMSD